jgi:DNA mismatch repair protein MutS2
MYAANEAGVINASVEFDEKTLRPTYRLVVGVAGASSGLEIARRFGVPPEIVQTAMKSVNESSLQASEYLRRIKREAEDAEALRVALEEERLAVAEKFASLDKEAAKHERERQTEFDKTVQRTIAELEKRSQDLVTKIEDRAERVRVEREAQRQVAEIKRTAQRAVRVVREGHPVQPEPETAVAEEAPKYVAVPSREIVVGDTVKLRSFGSIGIVDQIKDGVAEVRVKSLRLKEKLDNLELVAAQASQKTQAGKLEKLQRSKGTEVQLAAAEQKAQSELNVIGQTTDEAVDAVDKFLDEASMASLSKVRIVHGHGTGALRRAIAGLLNGHPHVSRFLPAPPDQGGTGATLVELRQ